jgi:hypothetical protein
MTDMRRGRLLQAPDADHSVSTLSNRVAHLSPSSSGAGLSNPSWKVIVSASRGQYLRPGSHEPGLFFAKLWWPSQRRLLQHFTALADHVAWPNIPYRTAVTLRAHSRQRFCDRSHASEAGRLRCRADRQRRSPAADGGDGRTGWRRGSTPTLSDNMPRQAGGLMQRNRNRSNAIDPALRFLEFEAY